MPEVTLRDGCAGPPGLRRSLSVSDCQGQGVDVSLVVLCAPEASGELDRMALQPASRGSSGVLRLCNAFSTRKVV